MEERIKELEQRISDLEDKLAETELELKKTYNKELENLGWKLVDILKLATEAQDKANKSLLVNQCLTSAIELDHKMVKILEDDYKERKGL